MRSMLLSHLFLEEVDLNFISKISMEYQSLQMINLLHYSISGYAQKTKIKTFVTIYENIFIQQKNNLSKIRNEIMNQNEKPLKQAENYFIINRCSFSGSTLSGGFSLESSKKRFTPSSIDRVEKLDLSNVEFSNEDFVDFFEKHMIGTPPADGKKNLFFIDPPYKGSNNLYGKSGDLHADFDHKKLFDIISCRKNWILTYNDCAYI